jgi:hypothetical protein
VFLSVGVVVSLTLSIYGFSSFAMVVALVRWFFFFCG